MSDDRHWLLSHCTQGKVGHPTAAEWNDAERCIGLKVPSDFRLIVDHCGLGHFGSLTLFNPSAASGDYVRLPEACFRSHRSLSENAEFAGIEIDSTWEKPSKAGVVLGNVNGDAFLFWRDLPSQTGWFLIDSETFRIEHLSADLIAHIAGAYRSFAGSSKPTVADGFWGVRSDGPEAVFTAAHRQA